jgi:hypothetical protein
MRRCYGWEGPDYTDPESYLMDDQYPYSTEYVDAIESLTGKPISLSLALAPREVEDIRMWTERPESEYYHWAVWMRRKIR